MACATGADAYMGGEEMQPILLVWVGKWVCCVWVS